MSRLSQISLKRGLFWIAFLLAVPAALAERVADVPNPRVRDGTWVTDVPSALRPDTVASLNALISELEQQTGAEMAVVVIRSLDGRPIEDFALELFNLWGVGKRESNNGLMLLWAVSDRRLRVQVGTGLESVISDSRAGQALDDFVIPRFREGRFDDGVLVGAQALASWVRGESAELPPEAMRAYPEAQAEEEPSGGLSFWLSLLGLGGAGAGGLAGFQRWRRYRRRRCPACQTQMTRLSESDDDAFLETAGKLEERLKSIDYDVWKCPSCSHHFVLRYPRWFSSYKSCPQCKHRTCSKTERTIRAATTSSSGLAEVTEDCEFCTYRRQYKKTLPRLSDSSSSSSSSSSFGGGSSSGGGASRGY